jgi:hypothetical protein
MALTDQIRAAVYARDKAICAFSGLSLWLLDFGSAPHGQPDWVDHIRPASRGGSDTLDNLVCASHFYNRKKLTNSSDTKYLFSGGKATEELFWSHGCLSIEQASTLVRHAAIDQSDWYFNRALFNLRVAMHDQWCCFPAKRSARYWQNAALRRLVTWKRLSGDRGPGSFIKRGLVRFPKAPDVKLMLQLASISTEDELRAIYRQLLRFYQANATALERFSLARDDAHRRAILAAAQKRHSVTEPLLAALRTHLAR